MRPDGQATSRERSRRNGRAEKLSALREQLCERVCARIVDLVGGPQEVGQASSQALAFGVEAIDRHLPGGGLRLGALHEVIESGPMDAQAALFVAGLSARLSGPVLWCLSGDHRPSRSFLPSPFAPGLAAVGLHPDRVIYAVARREADTLAAMEEGLRHRGPVCVVGEVGRLGLTASRRLQLSAEAGNRLALVIRRRTGREAGASEACSEDRSETRSASPCAEPSAAFTRWRIRPVRSPPLPLPGLLRARWRIELVRARGGAPRSWIVEAPDAQGRLHLPADLADRPAAPAERRAAAG